MHSSDIAFDAATHIYRAPDGRRIWSVTQILTAAGASTDFTALGQTSPRRAQQISLKRDIGSALHADSHAYDDGALDMTTVDPLVMPFLAAWIVVRRNLCLRPIWRERLIYHPEYDYTGQMDGIFLQEHTGKIILPDLKIGDPADAAADQQTAAYEAAYLAEHPSQHIDERWSIRLCPQLVVPYRITNYTALPDSWQDFENFKQSLHKVRSRERIVMPDNFAMDPADADEFRLEPEEDGPAVPVTTDPLASLFQVDEAGDAQPITLGEAIAGLTAPEPEIEPLRVMDVLPADFPLPVLVRFVPNPAVKKAVDEALAYAKGIDVAGKGAAAVEAADLALGALNAAIKGVEGEFEEPCDIAFRLHRTLTGKRGEWIGDAVVTAKQLGAAIYRENERIKAEIAEKRRKEQEEANRQERERLKKEAEAAAAAKAPEPVVKALEQKAATAVAAPVATTGGYSGGVSYGGRSSANTTVETWKAAPASTPEDATELNPSSKDMTAEQAEDFKKLCAAIGRGEHPHTLVEPNYSALNSRAKADGSALAIPGFKAVKRGGTRAKPGRRA